MVAVGLVKPGLWLVASWSHFPSLFWAVCPGFLRFPLNKTCSPTSLSGNQALSKLGASGTKGTSHRFCIFIILVLYKLVAVSSNPEGLVSFCPLMWGTALPRGVNIKRKHKARQWHVDGRPQTPAWDGGLNRMRWTLTGPDVESMEENAWKHSQGGEALGAGPGAPAWMGRSAEGRDSYSRGAKLTISHSLIHSALCIDLLRHEVAPWGNGWLWGYPS